MKLAVRIDCSPTEARRLCGAPDLLPIYQVLALTLEDRLVRIVARLGPARPKTAPREPGARPTRQGRLR